MHRSVETVEYRAQGQNQDHQFFFDFFYTRCLPGSVSINIKMKEASPTNLVLIKVRGKRKQKLCTRYEFEEKMKSTLYTGCPVSLLL